MAPTYGLGALRSPSDPRDYSIERLYAARGFAPAVSLPARFLWGPMPPVLDQGATPQCVAFANASEQAAFDIRDQCRWFSFDTGRFFRSIGGTPQGAFVRTALEERRKVGYPTIGHDDAGEHRIAAYYGVPKDLASVKAAIYAFGPLIVATPWHHSWFNPAPNGLLPAPSGGIAGGHAIEAWGWDDRLGLLWRNSWGRDWGMKGSCYVPYGSATSIPWEYWKAVDVIER